jgi:small GTP-binding protein
MIDTPGLDDEGLLGQLRVERARAVLEKTDLAIIAADCLNEIGDFEKDILAQIEARKIPAVLVLNKSDLAADMSELSLRAEHFQRTKNPGHSRIRHYGRRNRGAEACADSGASRSPGR